MSEPTSSEPESAPEPLPESAPESAPELLGLGGSPRAQVRRLRPPASRTSGRERHDEKITVYISSEELFAIEQARLVLRAEHGIPIDRGRLVREAVFELLLDLEAHGEDSVVVRRLHAR